jgi:hypothetical protein
MTSESKQRLAGVLAVTALAAATGLLSSCSNRDGAKPHDKVNAERATTEVAPPKEFSCLKASQGLGRLCAGPGFMPPQAKEVDVFHVSTAWCVLSRISFADPRSQMLCLPSSEECEQELVATRAGKQNVFTRTRCTPTTPDAWTAEPTEWKMPDAFHCPETPDLASKANGAVIHECTGMPADVLGTSDIVAKAWCFDELMGIRDPKNFEITQQCFRERDECISVATRRHIDNAEQLCALQGPEKNLKQFERRFLQHQ